MSNFSRQQVIVEATKRHGGPVCLDMIDDAMKEPTFEEAVDLIVCESEYLDKKQQG